MAFLLDLAGELVLDEILGESAAQGVESFTQGLVSAEEVQSVQAPIQTVRTGIKYLKRGKQVYDTVNEIMGHKRPRGNDDMDTGHGAEAVIGGAGGEQSITALHLPASNTITEKFFRYRALGFSFTHYKNATSIIATQVKRYAFNCNPETEALGWSRSLIGLTINQRRMKITKMSATILPWTVRGTENDAVIRANTTPQVWLKFGHVKNTVAAAISTVDEDNQTKEDIMLQLANTTDVTMSGSKLEIEMNPVVLHNLPSFTTAQTVTVRNSMKDKWFDQGDLPNIGTEAIQMRIYANANSLGLDHTGTFPDPSPEVHVPILEVVEVAYNFNS